MFYRLSLLLFAASHVTALWPIPQSITTGSTQLQLSPSFDITVSGIKSPPSDLKDAISRTKHYLTNDKLQRLVEGRGASDAQAIKGASHLAKLNLVFQGKNASSISEEAVAELESRVDSYTLSVPANGRDATVTANSTLGLFRGLTTFSQLWYDWEGITYTPEAPLDIVDAPVYVSTDSFQQTCSNLHISAIQRIHA